MRLSPRNRLIIGVTYLVTVGWFIAERLINRVPLRASVFMGNNLQGGLNLAQNSAAGLNTNTNATAPIQRGINLVLPYIGLGAVLAFVVAGFILLFGFGSETAVTKAKKIMTWVVIGLLVVLLAASIVQTVLLLS